MVKDLHDRLSVFTDQSVVDVFALTSGVDQALGSEHGQLLRQGGLADAQVFLKLADTELTLCQPAKQHEAVRVGQHLEQGASFLGRGLQCSQIRLVALGIGWVGFFHIHENDYVDKYSVCQ